MNADAATASHGLEPNQESFDERAFGFWVYLMTDAIIFALLFATFIVMVPNIASGPAPESLFDLWHTAGETALLLLSSLTFGVATISMFQKKRGLVLLWLAVTFVLGAGFVAMEIAEFRGMIAAGAGPDESGSLSAFFTLVGTHGLHVSTGLLWIVVFGIQVMVKGLTQPVTSRLFRLGLFWHFLDIVWIGIFSIVYLPGIM
jgi:cytochrome o ubiquinol oxidase subunit III